MIGVIFRQFGQIVEVRIDDNNLYFRQGSTSFATIDGIKLSKEGCIKENPDLADRKDWRQESINRFKVKLDSFNSEKKKMGYIIEDLKKYGFIPLYYQEKGHRPKKIMT